MTKARRFPPESSSDSEETLKTDLLDRRLIQALAINGRASFRQLAAVLGASEQTIARRYRRLRESGAVRVVVLPDPTRFPHHWLLRVQVQPAAAVAFSKAIARRSDVAWVELIAGGTEVTFMTRARTIRERDYLLLERLPAARQVVPVRALAILHRFRGGPEGDWRDLEDPLDERQVAALAPRRSSQVRPAVPGPEDATLLEALARDGRAGFAALAAESGDTEARIGRRVEALLAGGEVVVDVEVAAGLLGHRTGAWLWLTVAPSALQRVGDELAAHPEVPFAAAVSGSANLCVGISTADTGTLYRYLTDVLGKIEEVQSVEVTPILRSFKQAGTLVEGLRLPAAAS